MNKALATAALLVTTMTFGCTSQLDKSGGDAAPTTLVLASNDGTETVGAPGLAHFAELVREKSGGRLRVELSADWRDKGEQRVLDDVAQGRAELGWSGTRAMDTIGVNAFRPLHAPFLVSSYEAQERVVADAVAQDMLASLDGTGLTGLALLADELRFPAGAEAPLLEANDFEELDFGIMASNAQTAAMAALGARVKVMSVQRAPGTDGLEALETMWSTYVSNYQQRVVPFVTVNAVLWPRTTVIVANKEALDNLSSRDREIITGAARETAEWSIEHADDRVEGEIVRACDNGTRIALASSDQLASLRRAARPAYDALRADPAQKALLDRIERLIRGVAEPAPVEVPEGCAYEPGDENLSAVRVLPAPLTGPGRSGTLPAGTYRYTLSRDEIRDGAGMPEDFSMANAGVWTWTLDGDGRWSYLLKPFAQHVPEGYAGNTCEGYYDVHGHEVDFTTVTVYASGECASQTWKADWRQNETGLAMDVTTDGDDLDFLFGAKPWERIG